VGGAELEAIADDVSHADIRMTRRYLDRSRRKANNSALPIPVDFSLGAEEQYDCSALRSAWMPAVDWAAPVP
jgi:hypothetical protein